MQLSTKNIQLSQSKLKDVLTFTNSTKNRVIYKVKANNTQAFNIYPARGFIAPHQTLEIKISMWKYVDIKGKLLFAYAQVEGSPQTNFDKVWSSIQKQAFINEMIEILCTSSQHKEDKSQRILKKTESPIYEPQLQASNNFISLQPDESNLQKRQMMQSVIMHKTTTNMSKTFKDFRRQKQQEQKQMKDSRKLDKSKVFENQLRRQREQTKLLKQKLIQKEKKLKYYEQIAQKDINNSIQPEDQQQFKLNNLNVCLLILVCIFFGFFVAKINLKDSDI